MGGKSNTFFYLQKVFSIFSFLAKRKKGRLLETAFLAKPGRGTTPNRHKRTKRLIIFCF
jgi:hypothetical protein